MYYGSMFGGGFMFVFMFAFWIFIALGIVWLVRELTKK